MNRGGCTRRRVKEGFEVGLDFGRRWAECSRVQQRNKGGKTHTQEAQSAIPECSSALHALELAVVDSAGLEGQGQEAFIPALDVMGGV